MPPGASPSSHAPSASRAGRPHRLAGDRAARWSRPGAALAETPRRLSMCGSRSPARSGSSASPAGVRFLRGAGADAPAAARTVERASTDNFGHADWMAIVEARSLFDGGRAPIGRRRHRRGVSRRPGRDRAPPVRSARFRNLGARRAGAAVDLRSELRGDARHRLRRLGWLQDGLGLRAALCSPIVDRSSPSIPQPSSSRCSARRARHGPSGRRGRPRPPRRDRLQRSRLA